MTDQHHITPPDELVEQWTKRFIGLNGLISIRELVAQAASWGYDQAIKELEAFLGEKINESPATELAQKIADQELEACCDVIARELICDGEHLTGDLRTERRPKPLTLKEQALGALTTADGDDSPPVAIVITPSEIAIIRRALESLPE